MADENSRYNVTVTVAVQEVGKDGGFQDVIVKQYDMDYEIMHAMQTGITDAVRGVLVGWGDEIAEEIKGKRGNAGKVEADKFAR